MATKNTGVRIDADVKAEPKDHADPFFAKENIAHLEYVISKIKAGTASLTEHEPIEVD